MNRNLLKTALPTHPSSRTSAAISGRVQMRDPAQKVPQAQYLVASPHFVLDPGSTSGERPSIVRDDGSPEPKSAQLLFGES